jgi:hypothetical protein
VVPAVRVCLVNDFINLLVRGFTKHVLDNVKTLMGCRFDVPHYDHASRTAVLALQVGGEKSFLG